MTAYEEIRERVLEAVWGAPNQRVRPVELEHEHGIALSAIKDVLKELVDEGELVLTYRDPCSYVEIPFEESHHAARPMKVIPNKSGEYFICDDDVNPSGDLLEQGCWRCGDLAFMAGD